MQSCFRDKKLFLIILLNLMSITIYAQSVLKGKVVDQDSLPLPGVNVILKNESYGTVTDVNGDFTLRTQRTLTPKDKVVFSFMGYETKTLSYKESITNFSLSDISNKLINPYGFLKNGRMAIKGSFRVSFALAEWP